jgi:two-component system NtrC family sensor kinase
MKNKKRKRKNTHSSGERQSKDFRALSHRILHFANRGLSRIDFAREISGALIDFSKCQALELRLKRGDKYYVCQAKGGSKRSFACKQLPCWKTEGGDMLPCAQDNLAEEVLCRDILLGKVDRNSPFVTGEGSFWTGDADNTSIQKLLSGSETKMDKSKLRGDYRSFALFPLVVEEEPVGILLLKSRRKECFTLKEVESYQGVAQTLVVAEVHRRAQVALRERIKELTCLYGISRLSAQPDISLKDVLLRIAGLLPPAWLYPEVACGRIVLDGRSYATSNYNLGKQKQTADIEINEHRRGFVEVTYLEEKPELDEGPFLKEERILIDTIAKEVSVIVERREGEEEKSRLQHQLRHADRLATIGQLAAGVAHELNEPLGNALGFAQLAKKSPELPDQAKQDLEKAIMSSLHAREVIKKLMLFARRMPPRKTQVNLNQLVEEGLYFLESRCSKEGIQLLRTLEPDVPEITADPGQLTQVLVNLVVNAIQAMPKGGQLKVETRTGEGHISLAVEDTGMGMSDEVLKKLFIPFFTTKDINEGTGLGLSVVHGIVTSHGGTIKVESKVGLGTRFEIKLPLTGAPDVEENH